jgi:hypothetical protein
MTLRSCADVTLKNGRRYFSAIATDGAVVTLRRQHDGILAEETKAVKRRPD